MPSIVDEEISWYYGKGGEAARLSTVCQLEEARTRSIIGRRISAGPLAIVDIGGGPGAYATWLAGLGHDVDLVDPIELHLEQARSAAGEAGVALKGTHHGVAEVLPFAAGTFDVALMLGPLYHLPQRSHRIQALREAHRVLKPGGLLFAAAISRYAALVDGLFRDLVASPDFVSTMQRALRDGQHRNPTRRSGLFTTAYFHRVDELTGELEESGFAAIQAIPIEGPWPAVPDFQRKWQDDAFRNLVMECLEVIESDPSAVGFGGHLMAVGRRSIAEA